MNSDNLSSLSPSNRLQLPHLHSYPPSKSQESNPLCWYSPRYGHVVPDSIEGFVDVDDSKEEDEVSSSFKRRRFKELPTSCSEIAFDVDGDLWNDSLDPWLDLKKTNLEEVAEEKGKAEREIAEEEALLQKFCIDDPWDGVDPIMWLLGSKFPSYKASVGYKNEQKKRLFRILTSIFFVR